MSGILQTLFLGAAAAVKDAYFNLTTLLLNTTATNGAQNNTFLDSSTNNFTITRNGNTTQGTFTPFSQTGWSNYFSGSGDYLSVAADAAFNFGTGDFTLDAWIYRTASGSDTFIMSASGSGGLFWGIPANGDLGWGRAGVTWDYQVASGMVTNTWYHVALTRSGTSMKMFINGTQLGVTQTNSTSYNISTESGVTITELIKTISKTLDVDLEVSIKAENRTDIEKKRVGSVTKLKSTGWKPQYDLSKGIKETYEWINYLNGQK
jgi:hypothetical protein